jgi:ribonuclease HI
MKLVVHFDGGSRGNPGPAGAGVVVEDSQGRAVFEAGFFLGRMTNNMAEYSGLVRGLEAAVRAGAQEVAIFADSELVVRQLNGDYRVKNARLRDFFDAALVLLKTFERWNIKHIPREANHRADELANAAMDAGEDVVVLDATAAAEKPDSSRKVAGRLAAAPLAGDPASEFGHNQAAVRGPILKRSPPARSKADAPIVVARCIQPPDPAVCPAPCRPDAEFVFDRATPAGLCLELAPQLLRAVDAVSRSGKPVKVFCPRDGCGACFAVQPR